MKKFLIYFICSTAISITASLVYAKYYLSPKLKGIIETQLTEILGSPVQIRDLQVRILPNFSVAAAGIRFSDPKRKLLVEVRRIYVTLPLSLKLLNKKNPIGPIQVTVEEPKILVDSVAQDPAQKTLDDTPQPSQRITGVKFARDLALEIKVQKARIKLTEIPATNDKILAQKQITLEPLDFDLHIPSLEKDWSLVLKAQANFKQGDLSLNIPIQMKSEFSFNDMIFTTTQTSGDIGGIVFQVTGQQKLLENTGSWKVVTDIEDLSKLPEPPSLVPAKNWKGKVKAELRLVNFDASNWKIEADADFKNVSADMHFEKDDLKADGIFKLDLNTKLNYLKNLKIENLNVLANFDGLQIAKEKLFSKPIGTHLMMTLKSSGSVDQFKLQSLDFEFANLIASANGDLSLSKKSPIDLKFKIQRTELTGWEKYSPLLKASPLSGAIELAGSVKGNSDQLDALNIELSPLKLEKIKGQLNYQLDEHKINFAGPFEADANIQMKIRAKEIEDLKLTADANLSEMAIDYKDIFSKKKGENFKFKFSALKNENGIQLNNSNFEILHSALHLNGKLSNLERPKIQLNLSLSPLEISDAISLLPSFKNENYSGAVRGAVELNGIYDFKESIQKSPLQLVADLDITMPVLEYKSPVLTPTKAQNQTSKGQTAGQSSGQSSGEPILPSWPIFQNAKMKFNSKIKKFKYNQLQIDDLISLFSLDHGNLSGDVKIQNIFSGQAHLSNFKTDLKKTAPEFSGLLDFTKIDSNLALSFLSAEYKNILKSDASGLVQFSTVLPSQPDFMSQLRSAGKVNLKNALISSLQIDDIINDKISKIPGIGKQKPVASKGVAAEMWSQFSLAKGILNVLDFRMLTPEKNELLAKGSLEIASKNINLQGTAYLANAPVGGDIKLANSDSQQRFVIPFMLQGNLLKPEASFAQKSIEEILKNTLNYVAKRETESFKKDMKEDPKKAIQNKVDQLKKGLEGLFGK